MVETVDLNENVRQYLENIFDLSVEPDGSINKCQKRKFEKLSQLNKTPANTTIAKKKDSDIKKLNGRLEKSKKINQTSNLLEKEISNDSNLLSKMNEIRKYFDDPNTTPKNVQNIRESSQHKKIKKNPTQDKETNQSLIETVVENSILNKDIENRFSDTNLLFEEANNETSVMLNNEASIVLNDETPIALNDETPGLAGSELFRCGFFGCNKSFEVCNEKMQNHLENCEKRNSCDYICYHCKKSFKRSGGLMAHISFHGEHRYECGVCSSRFPMRVQCLSHMKYKHSTLNMESIPVDPSKANHYTDHFIVYPLTAEKEANNKKKPEKRNSTEQKRNESKSIAIPIPITNKFRPEDINHLPHERILNDMIYCASCSYSTKVTSNMLRHLKQHTNELFVPTLAPVNPVPHLHTNEMHFDKMTNLALSSNIDRAPMRRNSSTANNSYPQFIPMRERFVCGSVTCRYISLTEKMLQIHWNTLHKDENIFQCAHCLENVDLDTDPKTFTSRIWIHLKLHSEMLFSCSKCKFYHFSMEKMEQHKLDFHKNTSNILVIRLSATNENKWRCKICKILIEDKKEMLLHCNMKHRGLYQCSLCSHITPSKGFMDFHHKKHHSGSNKTFKNIYEKYSVYIRNNSINVTIQKRKLSSEEAESSTEQTSSVAKVRKTSQNIKDDPSVFHGEYSGVLYLFFLLFDASISDFSNIFYSI